MCGGHVGWDINIFKYSSKCSRDVGASVPVQTLLLVALTEARKTRASRMGWESSDHKTPAFETHTLYSALRCDAAVYSSAKFLSVCPQCIREGAKATPVTEGVIWSENMDHEYVVAPCASSFRSRWSTARAEQRRDFTRRRWWTLWV